MTARVLAIAIDCRATEPMVRFWSAALDYDVRQRWSDAHGVEYVELAGGRGGSMLLLQPVAEPKTGKNRLHLDIAPDDGDQYDEVRRLVGLGARVLADEPEHPWVVLADPQGNEFCVLPGG